MTIYLDRSKAQPITREEWYKMYNFEKTSVVGFTDEISQPYKTRSGTPVVINIEGTLIKVDDLNDICLGYHNIVEDFVRACKGDKPSETKTEFISFRWSRKRV